jgi:beta-glucosidase
MTLDEKIAQLHGIHTPEHYRYIPGVPRLGIPPLGITNGPAGAGPGQQFPQLRATALPAPISVAASWDLGLARRYGALAARESLDLDSDLLEGPDVNIIRNPQGGRSFESFSEDPYLDSRLAVASIDGIQSEHVLGNVKHYLANNQENHRMNIDERVRERALREIYMPAFKAAVQQADVASVMCAYPKVNGAFNCENKPLLTDVLKDEWHFRGFIMSDYGAVHSTVPSALNGLDLEMPTGKYFGSALKTAVQQGTVPISAINNMLVRRYATMMRFGLFGPQPKPGPIPVLQDGKASREMAEQGMVLLKNNSGLLPLDGRTVQSIALIGPYAVRANTGGGGSSHVIPLYTIEPADGIATHMVHDRLDVLDGCDLQAAVAAAKRASVAIVMVGDNDSEGRDQSLELPGAQNALIEAVAAANPRTIVVLKTGSAVLMPWLHSVAAVLEAWYPGEEDGDAVADVLFGKVNPSGKLPITFPTSAEQTPARDPSSYPGDGHAVHYTEGIEVGYRWYQSHNAQPLFPFGFGLSYTTFSFSDLKVAPGAAGSHSAEVRFRVTNTGHQAGAEVAQVYVGFPSLTEGNEPPRQLKGFSKIHLAPGESREVTIRLDANAFSYWSVKNHAWRIQPGGYTILAGSSSQDLPLSASLDLQ